MFEERTELRLDVDKDFLERLRKAMGLKKGSDVGRAALTLLNWAIDEIEGGRSILSATPDGTDIHKLAMTELANVKVRVSRGPDKKRR